MLGNTDLMLKIEYLQDNEVSRETEEKYIYGVFQNI